MTTATEDIIDEMTRPVMEEQEREIALDLTARMSGKWNMVNGAMKLENPSSDETLKEAESLLNQASNSNPKLKRAVHKLLSGEYSASSQQFAWNMLENNAASIRFVQLWLYLECGLRIGEVNKLLRKMSYAKQNRLMRNASQAVFDTAKVIHKWPN